MITTDDIIEANKVFINEHKPKPSLGSSLSSYMYYATIEERITSIVYGIIQNHSFIDANKRTAVLILYYLAEENNLKLNSDDVIFDVAVGIASKKYSFEEAVSKIFK